MNKIESPLVSVIVPSYNHAHFITECIESIVNQTYENIELTVIDDGSIDNSPNILKKLKIKYGFNLVFQKNHGISYTLNRGLKEFSSGKYFACCASDDYWPLYKVEKQVRFMESNQFYPMCYGKTYLIDEKSNLIEHKNKSPKLYKSGWIFDDIFIFKYHPPVNYMFRRSIFAEIGYYDETIFAEDYYMNLKISNKYAIGFLDEYLSYYRYTDLWNKIARFEKVSKSHLMAIKNYSNNPLYERAVTMVSLRMFDQFCGFKMYKKKAIKYMIKSIKLFYKKRFIISMIKLVFCWRINLK